MIELKLRSKTKHVYLIHFILYIAKTDGRRQGRIAHNEFQEYHDKNTYTMVLNCDISNLKQKNYFKKNEINNTQ